MDNQQFEKILARRLDLIRATLGIKAKEYAGNNDRLHNFRRASYILKTSMAKALVGMAVKHLVSILDIVDNIENGYTPTNDVIDEKIGDAINYFILLEAVMLDGRSI